MLVNELDARAKPGDWAILRGAPANDLGHPRVVGLELRCPGCGDRLVVTFRARGEPTHTWEGTPAAPSLHPEVTHSCGYAGALDAGRWSR